MARIRVIAAVGGILGATFACGQIVSPPGLAAPINVCPLHPCSAYVEPGAAPSCSAGVCTSATPMNDLVLVISLPTNAFVAPGRTYAMALSSEPTASGPCSPEDAGAPADDGGPCDPPRCSPPCCALPGYTQDTTNYVVDLDEATRVDWYLGNKTSTTSLPIEATYRLTWGPDGGDARSLGLPIDPVLGQLQRNPGGANPGPGNTPSLQSQAYLAPGCYERTLQPYEPFAQAFPPDIHVIPLSETSPLPASNVLVSFDPTAEQTGKKPIPTFQIKRANGLDGWTAYLRDQTTKRRFSNIAALAGSLAAINLATAHRSSNTQDALTNLEIVVAPPPGVPLPTYVAAPIEQSLPEVQLYPVLPTPVTMTGRVLTLPGTPVEADLVFTATDITDPTGAPEPSSFEFVARTRASVDPKTRASAYSVLLPRGHYQIVVVPRDVSSALTVVSRRVDGTGNTMTAEDIVVGTLRSVRGSAVVADGRPLAEATVEAVPTQCSADSHSAAAPDPAAPCMPRPAETTTADDGSFALAVDPGSYLLRVRPADGSRLPWVKRPIAVGTGLLKLAPITVPAPVHLSMTLLDGTMTCIGLDPQTIGNCVGNAVVRVFTDPSRDAPAIELGQAITDTSGHFEMYLAPPSGTP